MNAKKKFKKMWSSIWWKIEGVVTGIAAIILFVLAVMLVIGIFAIPMTYIDRKSCERFATANEIQYDYSVFGGGCLVHWNGDWIAPDHIYSQLIEDVEE